MYVHVVTVVISYSVCIDSTSICLALTVHVNLFMSVSGNITSFTVITLFPFSTYNIITYTSTCIIKTYYKFVKLSLWSH